ncbi:hypothetical protein [Spartinivicinus poritis]|uniref:Uncharacterized protein n=1 Tax=Spartinivicinus poritis TaxID=2994640 RepID=A0ABT5UF64_9GAMM|nr:hypothetical protein [Spartinivicinus sp. A2-2]MDE1465024.1 hypothetical protein [Spartinivicinus sp. A2-2]
MTINVGNISIRCRVNDDSKISSTQPNKPSNQSLQQNTTKKQNDNGKKKNNDETFIENQQETIEGLANFSTDSNQKAQEQISYVDNKVDQLRKESTVIIRNNITSLSDQIHELTKKISQLERQKKRWNKCL